jgi:hypothetical protein
LHAITPDDFLVVTSIPTLTKSLRAVLTEPRINCSRDILYFLNSNRFLETKLGLIDISWLEALRFVITLWLVTTDCNIACTYVNRLSGPTLHVSTCASTQNSSGLYIKVNYLTSSIYYTLNIISTSVIYAIVES